MVAMKSLFAVLPVFLTLTTALPGGIPPVSSNLADRGMVDVVSSENKTDVHVGINLYTDKNPDSNAVIDPETCEGKTAIATMKWRSECKALGALWRFDCWTDAPKESLCCPVAKGRGCRKYWPKEGEWAECLQMRKDCGPDCHWKDLTNDLQWCFKYAPDQ